MAFAVLTIFQSFGFVFLGLSMVHGQSLDQAVLAPGKRGDSVTKKAVALVESTLGSTNKLLERTAIVESKYGRDPRTYRSGYHGGIWQVDSNAFRSTQDVKMHPGLKAAHQKIKAKFGINWGKVDYVDLRKPLYSAIAARLDYKTNPSKVPKGLLDQAKYWKKHYNRRLGAGAVTKFISDVRSYDSRSTPTSCDDVAALGGNAIKGKKIFIQRAGKFHSVCSEKQKIGPSLSAIVGRKSGSDPGYCSYSNAMKTKGIVWSVDSLDTFLLNPRKFVPGTKMVFAGMKKKRERLDVIAYLCTL